MPFLLSDWLYFDSMGKFLTYLTNHPLLLTEFFTYHVEIG